jgi:hypothetical protein
MRFTTILLLCASVLLTVSPVPVSAVRISGEVRIQPAAGGSSDDLLPAGDAVLFFGPDGETSTVSLIARGGYFSGEVPPGEYTVLVQPLGILRRGEVFQGVAVTEEGTDWQPILTPDCYVPPAALARGSSFEQTFLATGTSVASAGFKLAGRFSGAVLRVSILDEPGGEQIGPERTVQPEWDPEVAVTWNAGEVPTTPGKTCVLRIEDVDGEPLGMYVSPDSGLGYPYGELLIDGEKSAFDGGFAISSNNDDILLALSVPAGEDSLPPATSIRQQFVAKGTSLAAVCIPLADDGAEQTLTAQLHHNGADGEKIGPVKTSAPTEARDGICFAAFTWRKGDVPLVPGGEYTLVFASASGEELSAFAGPEGDEGDAPAVTVYEYAEQPVAFEPPPPPAWEPTGAEETLELSNPGFEEGSCSGWENAWGGGDAFQIVGGDWKPGMFSGDAREPKEGEFCGVIMADHKKVRQLIRQWASWDYPSKNGQVRAVVWVASSDNADDVENPVTVRICVSGHGSVDAGNVAWSEPMISPGKWTPLVSPPATPAGGKMTLFLLVEGGSEDVAQYLKVDDLRLIVDRR